MSDDAYFYFRMENQECNSTKPYSSLLLFCTCLCNLKVRVLSILHLGHFVKEMLTAANYEVNICNLDI